MRLSISRIKAFKSCRRLYELRYIENLVPVVKSEALEVGSSYHHLLELLNSGQPLLNNPDFDENYSKEFAMALAYEKYIFPKFKVVEAEKWLECDLLDGDKFVGIVDALADDGHIVEHKTTSSEITEEYEYNLLWDEQILAYMFLSGRRKVWYTVCRKPTIRQKQSESDEEFFKRMVEWYDTDTDSKIRLLEIQRTDDEVARFHDDLMLIADEIKHTGLYYKNTCHCCMWGKRCEYSSICLDYNPNQEYIDFVKNDEYQK